MFLALMSQSSRLSSVRRGSEDVVSECGSALTDVLGDVLFSMATLGTTSTRHLICNLLPSSFSWRAPRCRVRQNKF